MSGIPLVNLYTELTRLIPNVVDADLAREAAQLSTELDTALSAPKATWRTIKTFWPPRLIDGIRKKRAMSFFGAGLSAPCGILTWRELLESKFGLDASLFDDEDLKGDNLTLAELAGQSLGAEKVQDILRNEMMRNRKVCVNQLLLASLRLPVYVTTNYDCLFESAWQMVNAAVPIAVVTNDGDFSTQEYADASQGGTILFKIHGSADRSLESMVLTRRAYRQHYRSNRKLFEEIRRLLLEFHTVFVGFSHRDPEVSRLAEDAIFKFESTQVANPLMTQRPQFYSLQFDLAQTHRPEVFAARGIVALNPPVVTRPVGDDRSHRLCIALLDLLGAKDHLHHDQAALEAELSFAMDIMSGAVSTVLNRLKQSEFDALSCLMGSSNIDWMIRLQQDLGAAGGQGIYLVDDQGVPVQSRLPTGLDVSVRKPPATFAQRPYFQDSKMFRQSFASNCFRSIFNNNATITFCVPILVDSRMKGLLFSAAQPGSWDAPSRAADGVWQKDGSFLLVDANGVCLLPARDEIPLRDAPVSSTEPVGMNIGYEFDDLLERSRRDSLARHVSRSVVPVAEDDDVMRFSEDFSMYSVVSEIPQTRWKMALSIPVYGG